MRHFIGHAGPITALALGMFEAPAQAGLIPLSGGTQTSLTRANGTPFRTVSVAPITVRADHHAFAAGYTKILSSSNVHGSVPWRARQDAALRDTLRMQRPCHHCQVTGRGIGKRPNFTAMSRLLLSTGRCHCARSSTCCTHAFPKKPTRTHAIYRYHMPSTACDVVLRSTSGQIAWSTEKTENKNHRKTIFDIMFTLLLFCVLMVLFIFYAHWRFNTITDALNSINRNI